MQIPQHILIAELQAAAKAAGRPLTTAEQQAAHTRCLRAALRERFINVIKLAGYKNNAPESICNEYLDRYMANVPEFVKMLEDYERNYGDPP